MSQEKVVEALVGVGLSVNEARAYVALLGAGACTGPEVGLRAGIPRTGMRGVLRRLVEEGAVRVVAGKPERYVATPPDGVLLGMKKRFEGRAHALADALRRLDARPEDSDVYGVRGYDHVLEEAERVASSATSSLVVSGWPREIARLQGALLEVERRRAFVVVFSHAALPPGTAGLHFSHGLDERALEAFWKHRLVVVADDHRTLIATTEDAPSDAAVVSENAAIAELATSQIALDVTLLAERWGKDAHEVLARMLGDRIGRLDSLLDAGAAPVVGERSPGAPRRPPARNGH